jgi:hypothetical protein
VDYLDSLHLAAYWGSRREPADRCGERLVRCLRGLAAADHAFRGWYSATTSDREMNRTDPLTDSRIVELLAAGRNNRDSDGSVIEELGYNLFLTNSSRSVEIMCVCGSDAAPLSNLFLLEVAPRTPTSTSWGTARHWLAELLAVIDAWEPDWAVVATNELRGQVQSSVLPFVSWVTYLQAERFRVSADSATQTVEVPNRGKIFVMADSIEDLDLDVLRALTAGLTSDSGPVV